MSPSSMLQAGVAFSEGQVRQNFETVRDAFLQMQDSLKRIEETTNDPHTRELARASLAKAGAA